MIAPTKEPEWSSRTGFILATVGSAVGIGSIWKFPYEVGANGGGAFVLAYLLGLALVVLPLMLAELALGRRGNADAAASIANAAVAEGRSHRWQVIGALGALTAFLILSYYSVIGGWAVSYAIDTAIDGLPDASQTATTDRFDRLLASPAKMFLFQGLFLGAVAAVVGRGVQRGIETAMKLLMPLLGVLLVLLAMYSLGVGEATETLRFLFVPDTDRLTARGLLDALGLGFFSIGVGLGLLITYAAYARPDIDLRTVAVVSIGADTAISIVAGLAVFPVVFANGLDPAEGPGLVFVALPLAFAAMPAGRVAATAFFALLVIAAFGSAVSMLEGAVAPLERVRGWSRRRSAIVASLACWATGTISVLSFNRWKDVRLLGSLDRYTDATPFDLLDELTSNLLLPLGGLALALFTGWVISDRLLSEELVAGRRTLAVLRGMLRFVVPLAIVAVGAVSLAG
ncbi:MAG: sodium-dependent transporter [Actinomycetota bacterium]|nr:sodium-dependent transporter [Actinomycetota bacterium]